MQQQNQQITNLRRIRKLLDLSPSMQSQDDLQFLQDFDKASDAINQIENKPVRRGVLTSANNALFTLAKETEDEDEKDALLKLAKKYSKISTDLNKDVNEEHTFEANPKQLKMFKTQKDLTQWFKDEDARAKAILRDNKKKKNPSNEDMKCLIGWVLSAMTYGGILAPVRGAEYAKMVIAQEPPDEDDEENRSKVWILPKTKEFWFLSHKSMAKIGVIKFVADRAWQLPFWKVLEQYLPFLRARLGASKIATVPLFIDVNTNRPFSNGVGINKMLQTETKKYLGVPLGSRALRMLYDSARSSALGGPDYLPLKERARQSLHTVETLLRYYIKDFKGESGTKQILSDFSSLAANAAVNANKFSKRDLRSITNESLVTLAAFLKQLYKDGGGDSESDSENESEVESEVEE